MELYKQFDEALKIMEEARSIVLAGHKEPDGDSIGSTLGFYTALRENLPRKEVVPYSYDNVPASLRFLKASRFIKHELNWFPDLVIGFDYGDFERLGLPQIVVGGARVITFDHHLESRQQGDVKIIDQSFASTTELVYEFFKAAGWAVSRDTALCLLTGIMTDTGGFLHNTSARTLKNTGELLQMGAPLEEVYAEAFIKSPRVINIWGNLLERIVKNTEHGYILLTVSYEDFKKYGIIADDLQGIVSILGVVSEANFAVFLAEHEPGRVKGSFRSEPYKGIDVAQIAKVLGGGGHKYAAGFSLACTLKEAQNKVEEAIIQVQKVQTVQKV